LCAAQAEVQTEPGELRQPLADVTFACIDLETTGGSPPDSRITEIGAVKYRGGERVGTFHTLVDPRIPIPGFVSSLTGIDDLLLHGSPAVGAVLPSLVEFLRGAVFVAHNAAFDFRFLNHDLAARGYDRIAGRAVCTVKLARRVLGGTSSTSSWRRLLTTSGRTTGRGTERWKTPRRARTCSTPSSISAGVSGS
jgi:DNA polymerase-3 subunit epsilon